MAKRIPLRIDKVAVALGGTYDYVKSDQVPENEVWCLQGISYENETGARGTFRRGRQKSGAYSWDAEHEAPAADELIFTDKILYLVEGEMLVIRQASATAADVIKLTAHGYRIMSKYLDGSE